MAVDGEVDQLARWSPLRIAALKNPEEADRLVAAAKDLERLVSSPGWELVQRWLATEQQKTLTYILRSPGDDRADTYALKKAHAAGYVDALKHAFDTPRAVLAIARQVEQERQRRAETAQMEGTG